MRGLVRLDVPCRSEARLCFGGSAEVKDEFDFWRFVFPKQGEHSVVPTSHPDRCGRAGLVNVLYCTSQRQNRKPYPHEVMLDKADGFDWETFCDCTLMYSVASAGLFGKRGRVTLERRRAIREKIRGQFLLLDTDWNNLPSTLARERSSPTILR